VRERGGKLGYALRFPLQAKWDKFSAHCDSQYELNERQTTAITITIITTTITTKQWQRYQEQEEE